MTPPDEASRAQINAARPDASTWLAANAGSGKTRVLTDRVARLLLDDVEPQHILCLTYTKAAASEMQNRLFERLGKWAMLAETDLVEALRGLGIEGDIDAAKLKKARTLFARAIETPGGLKIQTIHSFCASLLRRFPLEAGVSPQFVEIEDRAADLLRAEVVDKMAEEGDASLIADLARHYTGDSFDALTRDVVRHRDGFTKALDWSDAAALFDLDPAVNVEQLPHSVLQDVSSDWLQEVCGLLAVQSATMVSLGEQLLTLNLDDPRHGDLETLKACFLYKNDGKYRASAKTKGIPTKKAAEALGAHLPVFHELMERTAAALETEYALSAAQKTRALHNFAARFLPLYEEAKTQRGWLDFDDLINRARMLLSDEKVSAWVLFRIDGGIDHILVDEAQDTSPAQWDVIRKLAAEFTSGQGARGDVARTIFVVGDKKQSIYSFQGADPREFDRMQTEFEEKLTAVQQRFQKRTLQYSFRSARAILDVVDQTFDGQQAAGFGADATHNTFKTALPGRVDLWPAVEAAAKDTDSDRWFDPVDRVSSQHHNVILANRVADRIKAMIEDHELIPSDDVKDGQNLMRPVRAGDFLILVQRRSALFSEIIRACKANGLPIAGADRLKVGGELAVRDLAALLSFLSVPEDSLALASALKSPLFGWSEQQLFDLAHRRTQDHLWQALRARGAEFPDTMATLNDLRDSVGFLRPYDLIERILTRHRGRAKLLARLGAEAEDGINALLSQALSYERNAVPSLTGFLVWMETDDLEIKRQIDSNSDQIRVMTVHGAKGLEAPIVVLPDCGIRRNTVRDDIVTLDATPVWKMAAAEMPAAMAQAADAVKEAQAQERLRLLYVALTRAEKWLIVAAAGDLGKEDESWYNLVEAAMDRMGAHQIEVDGLAVKRLENGAWDAAQQAAATADPTIDTEIEDWYQEVAPAPAVRREVISASDLGGAKALAGDAGRDEDAAKAYGTLVHRFLEHLAAAAPDDWPRITETLTRDAEPSAAEAAREAVSVLQNSEFAWLFSDDTLSEVAVSTDFGTARLHGIIDRLIVEPDRILAVDFKTNQVVPEGAIDCPDGILRQMGAYAMALRQIYPERRIETAVLWTKSHKLMPLPHDIVMRALQSTPYLDAAVPAS